MKKNIKIVMVLVISIIVLSFLVASYISFGEYSLSKSDNKTKPNNNVLVDYSSDITSHYWCKSSEDVLTFCFIFNDGRVAYGMIGTDAVADSLKFDKIVRISDYIYEIYGIDGNYLVDDENNIYNKYNMVWKVQYDVDENIINIIEAKRMYLSGEKTEEVVEGYNNLKLYKREISDFSDFFSN